MQIIAWLQPDAFLCRSTATEKHPVEKQFSFQSSHRQCMCGMKSTAEFRIWLKILEFLRTKTLH